MQLSENNQKLVAVDNNDLINGTFIIPDGVIYADKQSFNNCSDITQITFPDKSHLERQAFFLSQSLKGLVFGDEVKIISHAFYCCTGLTQINFGHKVEILMQGFDLCTSLSQVTFGKEATLWHGVFKDCINLTTVMLGEGAKLHDHAFVECSALQSIIINTCSDDEIERVRNSLLPEYRAKVIKNPTWSSIISLQASHSYQDAFHPISLSDFVYCSSALRKIPFFVLAYTIGYEQKVHQYFQKAIDGLSIPTSIEDLSRYQEEFLALTLNRPQESVILWKKLECFNLVQRYHAFLIKLIHAKQQKYPAFFSDNGQVFVDVKIKLYVINKLMEWLKGDDEVCFTQDEVNLLNGETLIIRKLVELSIELPDEASSNAMVLG